MAKKGFQPSHTRTIALVGHRSAGKTSLGDVLVQAAGATRAVGRVDEGTSLLDHTAEARRHRRTLEPGTVWLPWRDHLVNVVDTPGAQGLATDVDRIAHLVDGLVLVVAANDDQAAHGTVRALERADASGTPAVAVVHQSDRPHDLQTTLDGLQAVTDRRVLPLQLPFHDDEGAFAGVVDLLEQRVLRYDPEGSGAFSPEPLPADLRGPAAAGLERIVEAVALEDEALLETNLEYLELPLAQVRDGLSDAVRAGRFLPVLLTSAARVVGALPVLDAIVDLLPDPLSARRRGLPDDDVFSASVLHHTIDADGRPCTLLRVWSGVGGRGGDWIDSETGATVRIRKLFQVRGPRRATAHSTGAGAVVATWDPVEARPGAVLSASDERVSLPPLHLPPVMARRSVVPRGPGDADRLERALATLLRMDPALEVEQQPRGPLVLGGRSPAQLERAARWLRERMGAAVDLMLPPVDYREAPVGPCRGVEGVHEHATPAGLVEAYGRCAIDLDPDDTCSDIAFEADCDEEELPRRFHAAIADGAREAARRGPLGGYPVIGARVTCVDGGYDILVSTEDHFRRAGAAAMRAALEAGGTRLLEPWTRVTIHAPADGVGSIIQDLTAHRGRIVDVQVGGEARIEALCPEREARHLSARLGAVSGGRAWFEARHSHYDPLPEGLVRDALRDALGPALGDGTASANHGAGVVSQAGK